MKKPHCAVCKQRIILEFPSADCACPDTPMYLERREVAGPPETQGEIGRRMAVQWKKKKGVVML